MSHEFLGDRKVALEEEFFAKQNQLLLRRLQENRQARSQKDALSAASGITDDSVLEQLAALGISSDTLAALSLVPLVAVAWADGSIDDKEREVAFSRAAEQGLGKQDVAYQMFEHWLADRPPPGLLAAWKSYIGALSPTLSDEARRALKRELLDRTRAVAGAAGGFLGIGRKISPAEEHVLTELDAAIPD